PEDVVMAVEFARTTVAEMREGDSARGHGELENLRRGIRVSETYLDAERCGEPDCVQRAVTFGSQSEQNRIALGGLAQLANVFHGRVAHPPRIVGAAEARLGG